MLRLRPYKKCDAKYILSWIKDEHAFRFWSADRYDHYPITQDDMNQHYAGFDEVDNFFAMTAYDENGVVGHMILRFTDDKKEVLRFGFVIVDDLKRGQGYGKKMLQLAIHYGFELLKVKKITLGVFENNVAAYHCYKSVGFKDVILDEYEYYTIHQERWKCLELELMKE